MGGGESASNPMGVDMFAVLLNVGRVSDWSHGTGEVLSRSMSRPVLTSLGTVLTVGLPSSVDASKASSPSHSLSSCAAATASLNCSTSLIVLWSCFDVASSSSCNGWKIRERSNSMEPPIKRGLNNPQVPLYIHSIQNKREQSLCKGWVPYLLLFTHNGIRIYHFTFNVCNIVAHSSSTFLDCIISSSLFVNCAL